MINLDMEIFMIIDILCLLTVYNSIQLNGSQGENVGFMRLRN